jgi:tripartite-type tricarboxylate transporter receptor subunit TctC
MQVLKYLIVAVRRVLTLRRARAASCVLAMSVLFASAASAAWPERTVTLLVPFAPGGISDIMARVTAERLQTAFKQPFIVENEPGGAGVLAAQKMLRAPADGYTLMFTPEFQITIAPFTHRVDFDPLKDFAPIGAIGTSPFVITVEASFPANSLSEFIAYVKTKPGELPYGSAGAGSLTQFSSAVFLKGAGLDMIHVPYKGVSQAFTDLLGGNIAMMSASPVEVKPYLQAGKVKPLAITGAVRSKQLPDVPTIAETFPSQPVVTYNGIIAAARTPKEIVDAISREIIAAEHSPEFLERLNKIGVEPIITTPADFAKIMAEDTERWRDLVGELGLKVQ